jgi:two-component system, OmpR family, response regulator ChvI
MPTIAVIDDDHDVLTSVSTLFESEGYRTITYADVLTALDALKRSPPDLAILDIKMPRMDGMEALRRLRKGSDIPVILLTVTEGEAAELVGFKMGADDCIRKPFSQRLLLERVKAVLRRRMLNDDPSLHLAKTIEYGEICLDVERHQCMWRNHPVALTATEFQIVQALVSRPGVVRSRDALIDIAHDDESCVDDRTIDCHIKRIRKKFRRADAQFDMIETLYGVGYRFRERSAPRRPAAGNQG